MITTNRLTPKQSNYLLNLPFIIGLIFLILNDHYLKGVYGNWFTGKLSDFAGILILPLFLKFVFKRSNSMSIIMTVVLFVFWKSPFSEPFIEVYNSISPISTARIVDYTDFWAFLMLPLSYYILENIKRFSFEFNFVTHQKWATSLLFTISLFSFIATQPTDGYYLNDDPLISNCCQSMPFATSIGNGKIFIPTIFTPDNNGINDVFQVVADSGIAQIDTFMIYHLNFDTIVFSKTNITEINPSTGWDGVFNDTIVLGRYSFFISATSTDSIHRMFSGIICCIPCGSPAGMTKPVNLASCGFATQYDVNTGIYDPNTSSLEELDCFE